MREMQVRKLDMILDFISGKEVNMTQRVDKVIEAYEKLDEDVRNRYGLTCNALIELAERPDKFNTICDTFAYGFVLGTKCQKAQSKRR